MRWSTKLLTCILGSLLIGCKVTADQPFPQQLPNTEQQRRVAMQAYESGDYHLAMGLLQTIDAQQSDRQASCYIGAIHFRLHEYQAAENKFRKCRLLNPGDASAWLNSAATHIRLATELLLEGKSYQSADEATGAQRPLNELLMALMRLQNIHREVSLDD